MNITDVQINYKAIRSSLLIDIMAITSIYFVPALSHLLNFPLYLIEPMRMMLILAMVHTNKKNAYLLALTLPLFSYFISGHPLFIKMLLISFELSLNVFLFYLLIKYLSNYFTAAFGSIMLSKLAYYAIKFILLNSLLINGNLISTPIYIQIITSLIFGLYCFLKKKKVTPE